MTFGTLGTGRVLDDSRMHWLCRVALVVDGFCYGENFFNLRHFDGSASDADAELIPYQSIVLSVVFWVISLVVFTGLGVNTIAIARIRMVQRVSKVSLVRFSSAVLDLTFKTICLQALLGLVAVVNVIEAETEDEQDRALDVNMAIFRFSLHFLAQWAGFWSSSFGTCGVAVHSICSGTVGGGVTVGVVLFFVFGGLSGLAGVLLGLMTQDGPAYPDFKHAIMALGTLNSGSNR